MDINTLAALGLVLASVLVRLVVRGGWTKGGQSFSCQIGDEVWTGRYKVANGQVHVICGENSRSAPVGMEKPSYVAERLLAEMNGRGRN